MQWKPYGSIISVVNDIPDGPIHDVADAIPDVYGKALQLYFDLTDADQKRTYHTDSVLMWRGLITLFALQGHLNLPLFWEEVPMPTSSENPFDIALSRPPSNPKHMLFDQSSMQWDGSKFYVLSWKEKSSKADDLLLYSPTTLVYPTANWCKIFADLPDVKWYSPSEKRFVATEDVLNVHERKIVYFWLMELKKQFNHSQPNEAQKMMARHLNQYMKDLKVSLLEKDQNLFSLTDIGRNNPSDILANLKQTVKAVIGVCPSAEEKPILTNRLFADQICYFVMSYSPFNNCLTPESYKIENRSDWYAFLPVHPLLREFCGENNLVQSVSMRWHKESNGEFISATLNIEGEEYERDYRVVKEVSEGKDLAVPFKDEEIDERTMPLISVWPRNIESAWQKYYIMLNGSNCKDGSLKVATIPGQNNIHMGDNTYTVQTDFPPYAIPIVRRFVGNEEKMSVGIVIPRLGEAAGAIQLQATVAVDFGTSSTMVFAKVDGQERPLYIGTDFPLMITKCDLQGERTMRDYFIPPKNYSCGTDTLFSIFRRSGNKLKNEVEPVLDGTIYQTSSAQDDNGRYLITNLKWQIRSRKAYYIAFMKQLVLHITTLLYKQGVNSIIWKYAFPESMVEGDRDEVKMIWEKQLITYLESVTENISHTIDGPLTESEAASRYFLSRQLGPVHSGIGYLVVDIGGGSTDIALWQGDAQNAQMLWHTSFEVAGRKMFTRWIMRDLQNLCAGIADDEVTRKVNIIQGDGLPDDTKLTLVEVLLNSNYDNILRNYQQDRRESLDGWGEHLYLDISQAMSILMFALGYQIGVLLFRKEFEIPNAPGAFVIAFGGRGSKMLDWMKTVDAEDSGTCNGRLEAVFRSGIKAAGGTMTDNLQIITEPTFPKCEVARGLLVDWKTSSHKIHAPAKISMDTQKYLDGMENFKDVFGMFFGGELQIPDQNMIAAQLNNHPEKANQIVDVFMQIIYEGMVRMNINNKKASSS